MNNTGTKYPVQKGEAIELYISGMNHQGEGVGRYEGFAVFVPFALPEDRVTVQIEEVKSSYARGRVIKHLTSSDYRTENQCSSFGECGGCQLQHYDYSRQLLFKQDIVKNALQRIGKLEEVNVLPTIGMKDPYAYRNKAEYPVRLEEGVLSSGFFASMSSRLVVLQQMCPIQHPSLEKTRKAFMDICNQRDFQSIFIDAGINQLVVRVGENTGEVMVLIMVEKPLTGIGSFLSQLLEAVPEIVSIYQKNHRKSPGKKQAKYELMEGKSFIREKISGLDFDISPGSFFQVNSTQAGVLFSKTLEYADCKGVAVDAYCGTGSISLFLAKQAEKVYGIESFPDAVLDARHNGAINRFDNAEFIQGDAGEILETLEGVNPEAVVIDPPRAGCDSKALEAIVKLLPQKIVYVSCNPATLARDLKILVDRGYVVIEVQPIDMFPQTYHCECVVKLVRN